MRVFSGNLFIEHYFADEIDSLLKDRQNEANKGGGSILNALLVEMDGKRENVYVIANTNVPEQIGNN